MLHPTERSVLKKCIHSKLKGRIVINLSNEHPLGTRQLFFYMMGRSFWCSFLAVVFAAEDTLSANHDSYLNKLNQYDEGFWMTGLQSSYSAEDKLSFIEEEDHLAYIRPLLQAQEQQRVLQSATTGEDASSLLQVGSSVSKVHAFCEICIMIMQMKMRGQPHLCAGMNPDYFITVTPPAHIQTHTLVSGVRKST